MRILQIIPYFVPAWGFGGPIPVCYELSKKLVEHGHSVTVCTTDALDSKARIKIREETLDGIDIIRFRNVSNYLAWHHNMFTPIKFKNFIKKNLKDFDIVHLHDYRTYLNIVLTHYACKYGVPYVLQPHGTTYIILKKQWLKRYFDKKFGYKIIKKADAVIALNETKKIQINKMGAELNKIKIIPNAIDVKVLNKTPEKGTFRDKYLINKRERIILYVGRIHSSKGINILIESFANLLYNLPNSKLVLVGPDDGYTDDIRYIVNKFKINNSVIFTGFVDSNEKKAAYADADIFVTPNFTGFPITFLEAMFFGLPIITTNRGDKLDWIHNKVGYVTDYDKNQLKDAIFRFLSDEKLTKRFKKEAMALLKEQFNWNNVADKVEKLYETIKTR